MLPTFPKAQKVLDDAWRAQMWSARDKAFPQPFQPPVHPIIEGKKSDFQQEDRTIKPLKMKHHQISTTHNIKDDRGMTLGDFTKTAKEIGEGLGRRMSQSVFGAIEEAVREIGNVVHIKKGDLKQEDIFRMLEVVQSNFDENGNPTGRLVCGSEFAEEIRKREAVWKNDSQFLAKLDEIRKRKKAEFNEREARRRIG